MNRPAGFLLVRAGSRALGLPLSQVIEVTQLGEVRTIPVLEPAVRGVVALRNRMVPLVHLGSLLEGKPCPPRTGNVGVVVMVEARRVCLEVEEAEILVHEATLPVPAGETLPWAVGVARYDGRLVPLLNVPALGSRLEVAP